MEAKTYNAEGKVSGSINLPQEIFGLPWNADLVHQVTVSMQGNARMPVAHTKGVGEVRGGGRKPWQQKGTGRARHGSSRSPIWRGGGVTHGPRNEKDYGRKINRKMRVKALYTVLSRKLKDNEIIFVDSLDFKEPKTAQAVSMLKALSGSGFEALLHKNHNAALVALPEHNINVMKSFRNIGKVMVLGAQNLNPVNVLNYKYLVIAKPDVVVKTLANRGNAPVVSVAKTEPAKKVATRKRVTATKKVKAASKKKTK